MFRSYEMFLFPFYFATRRTDFKIQIRFFIDQNLTFEALNRRKRGVSDEVCEEH